MIFFSKKYNLNYAIQRLAKFEGDLRQLIVMRAEYNSLLQKVSPQVEWWRFAELKQTVVDLDEEIEAMKKRVDTAHNAMEALLVLATTR